MAIGHGGDDSDDMDGDEVANEVNARGVGGVENEHFLTRSV